MSTKITVVVALLTSALVIGVMALDYFNPIDKTFIVHFDNPSFAQDTAYMLFGNRIAGDIDGEYGHPVNRVSFRVVGYPTPSVIELPEVLANWATDACVIKEYRFLPPITECYPLQRI